MFSANYRAWVSVRVESGTLQIKYMGDWEDVMTMEPGHKMSVTERGTKTK